MCIALHVYCILTIIQCTVNMYTINLPISYILIRVAGTVNLARFMISNQ